ncbi:hypothetical protein PS627_00693 [Pseudomonas fluorescens]|nr:hypothetical protein PS627_00693 [Pseudomonas fluorescens]VVP70167.1 hypothetical protein PS910_00709 [Pseudomonas fluorescens]
MYRDSGRILAGAGDGNESNEAKVNIIANDVGHQWAGKPAQMG